MVFTAYRFCFEKGVSASVYYKTWLTLTGKIQLKGMECSLDECSIKLISNFACKRLRCLFFMGKGSLKKILIQSTIVMLFLCLLLSLLQDPSWTLQRPTGSCLCWKRSKFNGCIKLDTLFNTYLCPKKKYTLCMACTVSHQESHHFFPPKMAPE